MLKEQASNSAASWGTDFRYPWFSIGSEIVTIAAGSEEVLNFNTPGDTEFALSELQVQADNENGDSIHVGFKLEDSTGRQYTQGFVPLNYFANSGAAHAERPINLGLIFRHNAQIRLTLRNFAANAATNLLVGLFGRKNFGPYSWYDQLSEGFRAK